MVVRQQAAEGAVLTLDASSVVDNAETVEAVEAGHSLARRVLTELRATLTMTTNESGAVL